MLDEGRLYQVALDSSEVDSIYHLYSGNKNAPILASTSTITGLLAYPNPFTNRVKIHFALDTMQKVRIVIYDTYGKLIVVLKDENMHKGEHKAVWNINNNSTQKIPAGLYILRIIGEQNGEQKTLIRLN